MTEPLSEHFTAREFACRCGCGSDIVSNKLILVLEGIRARLGGVPVQVVSGRRCPEWNRYVGGAKRSQHLVGNAADIRMKDLTPVQVARAARAVLDELVGPDRGGVGIYNTFTHVDVREGPPWAGDLRTG